jgi:PAS domain S-box-containing protein
MLRGTVQDITEQKKAEEALKEKERESSEAQRLGQIGSWDWDIATDTIVWTTECYLLMGFEPGTKPPQYEQHLKIYTPESAARLDAAVKKEMETGEAYELDLETSDPKNPHRWITARSETKRDHSGKIIGLRGTAQDITERKKTEVMLQESEKKYRELIQKIKAAVVVYGPNTEIKTCNPTAQELLGLTEDQLLGKLVNELPQQLFNEDGTAIPVEEHPVNKVFATRQPLKNFITRLHRPTKENDIWVLANADPVFNEKGKIEQVIVTFVDITEHKQVEEKMKELDKLKDDFLSLTTHELKSPITPIKAQAQLLLKGEYGDLNTEQKDAIEMIHRNSEILDILSGEVLELSKIRSNKLNLVLEEADLGETLIDVVNIIKMYADAKKISISISPIPEMSKISMDKMRVKHAILNLLTNAIKFTQDNGSINIKVIKKENGVAVAIKDSGIDIEGSAMTKIFEPFFQVNSAVNRKYHGTGLGLTIAKGIVEAHGGNILVESGGENKGSIFTIVLPGKAILEKKSDSGVL